MKCEWKQIRIGDLGLVITGKTPQTKNAKYWGGHRLFITPKDLQRTKHIFQTERIITDAGLESVKGCKLPARAVCVSCIGNIGYVGMTTQDCISNQQINSIVVNKDYDADYVYYVMRGLWPLFKKYEGSSTALSILNKSQFSNIRVRVVTDIKIQRRIAAILSSLDDKIELNNKINANLEQQAQALFKAWFVDFEPFGGKMPEDWRIDSAECFYNIGIGKTPPRVEAQWFTKNRNGIVWVSIADMGKSGLFIGDSDEYLTEEAVERFNVKVIPEDTVILSFKLTVGRVCITAEKVTTNEAIAHFGMGPENSLEYLYCYLKNFDYGTLGNTSSIALAVNSKTIKKMPIVMPDRKTLMEFHLIVGSLFNRIKLNISENASLATLRDALLPRLMSGQIEL